MPSFGTPTRTQPLRNGIASAPDFLAAPAQQAALLRLEFVANDDANDATSVCTAVLVGSRIALMAAHCWPQPARAEGVAAADLTTAFARDRDREADWQIRTANDQTTVAVLRVAAHPTLDLAVAILGREVVQAAPFALALTAPVQEEELMIAGAGLGTPDSDVVHYAAMVVMSFGDDTIVSGAADAGTCSGDSGAPLLRNVGGQAALAGIHVRGFAGCLGNGTAVRTDIAAVRDFVDAARTVDWLMSEECDSEGRTQCADEQLRRCVDGTWRGRACSLTMGSECRDDTCASVPCDDVTPTGRCRDNIAEACVFGAKVQTECTSEKMCALDPALARFACVPRPMSTDGGEREPVGEDENPNMEPDDPRNPSVPMSCHSGAPALLVAWFLFFRQHRTHRKDEKEQRRHF